MPSHLARFIGHCGTGSMTDWWAWSCAILVARDGDGGSRCADLLAIDLKQAPKSNQPLPFDLSRSYQLYRELFGQVEDLIKGKHLLIVPSGALT